MASGHLRMDLGVIRQGLHLLFEFGVRPLEEMTRVAELIEHSVYEKGSLGRRGESISFVLLNPPLRMGAFSEISLTFDSTPVPKDLVTVEPGPRAAPRTLADLSRDRPLTLPVGVRTRFRFTAPVTGPGPHRVRLDLHSVAIPPRVWFEFHDHLADDLAPGSPDGSGGGP